MVDIEKELITCKPSLSWLSFVHRRVNHVIPGKYGFGRTPHVAPLQTHRGQVAGRARPHRQRRSAVADAHHPSTRGQGGLRHPSNNLYPYRRPYMQLQAQKPPNNPVWAPLYRPGSANHAQVQHDVRMGSRMYEQQHQDRPYDPLPTSFCPGEHVHYRICNSDVCTSAPSSY